MHLFHTQNTHVDVHLFPDIGKTRSLRVTVRKRNPKTRLWRIIRIKFFEYNAPHHRTSRGTMSWEVATWISKVPKEGNLRDALTWKQFIRIKIGFGGKK